MILTQPSTFVRLPAGAIPHSALMAFASDQDAALDLLRCRIHKIWALGMRSFIGVCNGPRYTENMTIERLPFLEEMRKAEMKMNRDKGNEGDEKQMQPSSLSLSSPSSLLINLSSVSARLNEAWKRWLNPGCANKLEQANLPAKQSGEGL